MWVELISKETLATAYSEINLELPLNHNVTIKQCVLKQVTTATTPNDPPQYETLTSNFRTMSNISPGRISNGGLTAVPSRGSLDSGRRAFSAKHCLRSKGSLSPISIRMDSGLSGRGSFAEQVSLSSIASGGRPWSAVSAPAVLIDMESEEHFES